MSTPKSMVRAIGNEIQALSQIQDILKKYGLTSAKYVGGSIGYDSFKISIEFGHEIEVGDAKGPSKFAQHGLPEDIIGKSIKLSGRMFRIADVKAQNSQGSLKKCVIIEGSGGGRYVVTAAEVKRALGLAPMGTLIQRPAPGDELVELKNGYKVTPLSPELTTKFKALAASLSPENLSNDGELSQGAINLKRNIILREWAQLEAQVGRKVTTNEFPY